MPLDRYTASLTDIATVGRAIDVAATGCMHALGYTSWTTATVQDSLPAADDEHELLGYLDPAVAARAGYPAPAHDTPNAAGPAPAGARAAQPSHDAMAAYLGGEPGARPAAGPRRREAASGTAGRSYRRPGRCRWTRAASP
jgi:hypothetical protein